MSAGPDIDDRGSAQHEVHTELREYLHSRDDRHRVFPKAALVGLLAGIVAVAFRSLLALADYARNRIEALSHGSPFGWLAPVLVSGLGAFAALLVVRRWATEASGSGIPHVESVLRRHRIFDWKRILPAKFVGGVMAIGSGLALGREGPTIQMGAAVGAGTARQLRTSTQERLVLIAAGAGAGLAAAFNAPLAGLVFVLEELQRDFRPMVFGAAFIAAAAADVVSRLFSGQLPVFTAPAYPAPTLTLLPIFALLGVVAGLLGVAFNNGIVAALNGFASMGAKTKTWAVVTLGAVVGLIGYFHPGLIGSGHTIAELALEAKLAFAALPIFFATRFLLTLGSYGTGVPGGIFAPLLALGALLGLFVGDLSLKLFPAAGVLPGAFAVVGMAAYFTAIVRAPLTGIVLIVEMTSSYSLSLPLLVACFSAYGVAEATRNLPIYETLLQRDLASGGGESEDNGETLVLEYEVEPGSPFERRTVRELGLPSGVLFVTCRDGHREWLPDAGTRLEAHMRVTAVVSAHAKNGRAVLQEGFRSRE